MAEDKKISQIGRQIPLLSDVVVAARDNNGNPINITFTLQDILASVTGSPFKIVSTDPEYSTEEDATDPDSVIINSIITDERLIGKSGYPVYSTQTNTEFRNDDLVYNAVAGTLMIKNFELMAGEHISIYPTLAPSNDGANYQDLLDQMNTINQELNTVKQSNQAMTESMEELLLISAPLKDSIVWFNKPANMIPQGWAEATEWRGKIGVSLNPDDPDFATLGNTGGSKTHTNTLEEMVPHNHDVSTNPNSSGTRWPFRVGPGYNTANEKTGITGGVVINGTRQAKPYSIMNPYRVVLFIKWIGI